VTVCSCHSWRLIIPALADMMGKFIQHPIGRALLAAALVLEIVGILVFRKIIKIHI
jgi:Flp pilus assembly protein TadB